MAVTFVSTEHLQGIITVHIPSEEYQPLLQKGLNNHKNKAQLKGFRKGKTSVDLIKKMYGNAILQEVVENMLQKQLFEHLQQNNINLLGQPLPNVEQENIYYNIFNDSAYTFKFDIGYTSDVEIKGLDHVFELQKVQAADESIEKQLLTLRNRIGGLQPVDGPVTEEQMLTIHASEVVNGTIKAEGVQSEFSLWISQLDEVAKSQFVGKQKNDQLTIDIQTLHPDKEEAFIRQRYFNTLEEAKNLPTTFQLTITDIKANVLAELNQAFFDQAFGPEAVQTEDEAKSKIKGEIEKQIGHQADALLFRNIQDYLLKANKQDFPDSFLKRWLKTQNERLSDEKLDADYPDFTQNLTWTIIREKLVKQFEIKVEQADIKVRIRQQIMSYFGGMALGDLSFMEPTIQKMMQNREQVEKLHDEVLTDKLFDSLKSVVQIIPKEVSEVEFNALMETARKDTEARKKKSHAFHEHEGHDHEDHDHDHDHDDHHHH